MLKGIGASYLDVEETSSSRPKSVSSDFIQGVEVAAARSAAVFLFLWERPIS